MSPSSHAGFPFSRTLARRRHITELFVHTRQPNARTCQLGATDMYGAGATTCPPSPPLNAVTDHPFNQDKTWKGGGKITPSLARILTHINVCCSQCLESLQNKVSPPRSLNARVASPSLTISKTPFYQQPLKKKRHTSKTES